MSNETKNPVSKGTAFWLVICVLLVLLIIFVFLVVGTRSMQVYDGTLEKAYEKSETLGGNPTYFDPANPNETFEVYRAGTVWFINLRLDKSYGGVVEAMNKFQEWQAEHPELEVTNFDYEMYPGYKLDQHIVIIMTKPAN